MYYLARWKGGRSHLHIKDYGRGEILTVLVRVREVRKRRQRLLIEEM
jgi:hypothetical protein